MTITSKFVRYFHDNANLEPATGMTVWLVPQTVGSPSYPSDFLACTEHGTRSGVYYRENVPDGEYKVYIDVAGGTTPVLYDENIWVGEKRLSYLEESFVFKKVQLTGVDGTEQTFATGTAPLDEDQYGNAPPTFDATLDLVRVQVATEQYCEAQAFCPEDPAIAGGVLGFKVRVSPGGAPNLVDGNYYADIIVFRRRKVV